MVSKRMLARLLAAALVALALVPMLACPAFADREALADGVWYMLHDDGTATVSWLSASASGEFEIPALFDASTLDYYAVTAIGDGVFKGCKRLTSVEVPVSVKSIGKSAFSDCKSLQSVEFARGSRLVKGHVFLWPGAKDWHDLWDEDGVIVK